MTDAKILKFPEHRVKRDVPTEAIVAREQKGKKNRCDKLHDDFVEWVFDQFDEWGYDTFDEQLKSDLTVMLDFARAAMYRQEGLDHHLHEFIDESMVIAPRQKVEADFAAKQEANRASAPIAENTGILSVEVPLKV